MKVSVCMITYNQEKHIKQAVESVMVQEADFEYELVIGEDCSSDKTRKILLELKEKYPNKIRLLLPDENMGMQRNFAATLEACQGQYVALLEGDDYWTCPQKLQKQVDLLDNTPECALCFHSVIRFEEESDQEPTLFPLPGQPFISTIHELIHGNFIQTCSVMFRRELIINYPTWMLDLSVGDWPLFIFIAQYGDLRFLEDTMAAYRIHRGGVWSMTDASWRYREGIKMLKHLDQHMNFKYHDSVRISLSHQYYMLSYEYITINALSDAREAINKSIMEVPRKKILSQKHLFKRWLNVWAPALYKMIKRPERDK